MHGKHQRIRVRILVKAFPQHGQKYEETVCCAGITEDGRKMLRLFPNRFRRLPREHQFDRFDLVETTATKASDPRPESFHVDEGSIRLIEHGNKLSDAAKVQFWHCIMGTMAAHPRTFIIIGLLRCALDPAELARQEMRGPAPPGRARFLRVRPRAAAVHSAIRSRQSGPTRSRA